MKKPVCLALSTALSLSAMSLHADDTPKDQKDKVSYSIGLDIGTRMKQQGLEVNPEMLSSGIKDGFTGTKPKLTEEDIQKTMEAFSAEMRVKMEAQQKQMAEENKKAGAENKAKGDAFLAENKKKEGWKTLPSGLQYRVIKEGKGEKPKATDTVSTNYRGTLIDGKEFDSSYKRNEPAEFPVNGVIPGWTEALQLMPVGSKWQIAVPANLAYGESAPPEIGPNSVLLFDIELLDIKKPSGNGKTEGPASEKK
jgi:FKBP-type peptidyl-prolyl cis-trans isomerase FklB